MPISLPRERERESSRVPGTRGGDTLVAASASRTELFHDAVEDGVEGAVVGFGAMTEGAGAAEGREEAEGGG